MHAYNVVGLLLGYIMSTVLINVITMSLALFRITCRRYMYINFWVARMSGVCHFTNMKGPVM